MAPGGYLPVQMVADMDFKNILVVRGIKECGC